MCTIHIKYIGMLDATQTKPTVQMDGLTAQLLPKD